MSKKSRRRVLGFGLVLGFAAMSGGATALETHNFSKLTLPQDSTSPTPPIMLRLAFNDPVLPISLLKQDRQAAASDLHALLSSDNLADLRKTIAWDHQRMLAAKTAHPTAALWMLVVMMVSVLASVMLAVFAILRPKTKRRRSYYRCTQTRTPMERRLTREALQEIQSLSTCFLARQKADGQVAHRPLITRPSLITVIDQIEASILWLCDVIEANETISFADPDSEVSYKRFLGWVLALPRHKAARFGLGGLRDAALELEVAINACRGDADVVTLPLYRLKSRQTEPLRMVG